MDSRRQFFPLRSTFGFCASFHALNIAVALIWGAISGLANAGKVLAMPDVKANLSEQGITTKGSTPEQMKELVASDYQRWTKIIKGAGIRAD